MGSGRYFYLMVVVALSIVYGWLLSELPLDAFKDRSNYLVYAEKSPLILSHYWSDGILTGLANEPIWLLINVILGSMLEPETTLRVIIGVPAGIVAFQVLRTNPKNFMWLLFFLFLPQVIKNHIVHLRQGVAISFFLVGWFSHRALIRWCFILFTPFIHASFFFILLFLLLTYPLRRLKFAADLRNVVFVFLGIFISMCLPVVSDFLGARQSDVYDFESVNVSGIGFIFWFMVLMLLTLEGKVFVRQHMFIIGLLILYLSTYFFVEVSARIFESVFFILLLACLQMTTWRYKVFCVAIIVYGLFGYISNFNQPWFGFGVL